MICIIGAMPEEVSALTALMSEITEEKDNVVLGTLAHKEVVICTSGVGKVNAALTATQVVLKYKPEMVINIGSAGGLLEGQKVGDVVIADKLQYHDFDIGPDTVNDERFIFYSDKMLNTKLETVLQGLKQDYHKGLMVSGDQFIIKTNPAFKNIQEKHPKANCTEMEATALAHVCSKFEIPFVVMRALSDVAFNNEDDIEFETFLPLAAKNSANICLEFIKNLSNEN